MKSWLSKIFGLEVLFGVLFVIGVGCIIGGCRYGFTAESAQAIQAEKLEAKQPTPRILTDNKKIHYDFVDRIDYKAGRYLDIFILTERKTHKQYLLVFATNNGSPPHLALSVTPMER